MISDEKNRKQVYLAHGLSVGESNTYRSCSRMWRMYFRNSCRPLPNNAKFLELLINKSLPHLVPSSLFIIHQRGK